MAVVFVAECVSKLSRPLSGRVIAIAIVVANIRGLRFARRPAWGRNSSASSKARELIRVYGKGEGAVKAFCSTCGSSLFGGDWPDGPQVSIRMGTFDDDPGIRPQFHTFVDSRAPWDTITDDLPQYAEAWKP